MSRIAIALVALAALVPAAHAQEAAPTPEITVDPRAIVDSMPQQGLLLTGLYATQATIELCSVTVSEPGTTAMNAHRRQLESEMRMDADTATKAYDAIKADVEEAGLDCAEGSDDRAQADQVIAIYSGQGVAAPASPADAVPVAPVEAPAAPAQ